jgi:hypothetical protein
MFYKTLLTGLLALGTIVCTAQTTANQSPKLKAALERFREVLYSPGPNFDDYHSMKAATRRLLIAHFWEQERRAGPNHPIGSNPPGDEARRALILLSDPEMIDFVLHEFSDAPIDHLSRKTFQLLLIVSDPVAIKRLAPEMKKNEPFERRIHRDDSSACVPKSYTAAQLMLRIVANSPAFEGNTRKWAGLNERLGEEERQGVVGRWWKDNERFFKGTDYKSVKPGEPLMETRAEEARRIAERVAAEAAAVAAEKAAREAAFLERISQFDGFARPRNDTYYGMTAEERRLLIKHFRERLQAIEMVRKKIQDYWASISKGIRAKPPKEMHESDRAMDEYWANKAKRALLLLNDPESVDPIVQTFCEAPLERLEGGIMESLRFLSDPKVIERLAPEMEKDEPFKRAEPPGYHTPLPQAVCYVPGYDVPKPYYAAHLMLTIMANSRAFEDNARKWAEDHAGLPLGMDASDDHARSQGVVRQWWKENERFFKAGDYKSVKPGEQLAEKIGQKMRATSGQRPGMPR